ncbi:AAA family ATPase [[Clostridium] fimetarium]|uniref:AAA domain-containing protein n=1 Tax=[Clostridium] fimetarium TaxID=99656 RepID=A0A1I0P304_9FIRM|nr:AAA family ATPase [[Clostridium] fimetarium]SEW08545.1 hypothetical protein SAMN05421659_104114 [[Clostridium] fimetarium]
MNKRILRTAYLQILEEFKDKDIIKIITGIRRCGKSTLMEIFQDYLRENGVDEKHNISINFEDYNYVDLLEPKVLHTYVQESNTFEKCVLTLIRK